MAHPGGRPTSFTEEKAEQILSRISDGESLRSVSRDPNMPAWSTLNEWTLGRCGASKKFPDQYARARRRRAEVLAEEILEISDGAAEAADALAEYESEDEEDAWSKAKKYRRVYNEEIQARKLRVDARKWFASKCDKRWAEHSALDVGGQAGNPVRTLQDIPRGKLSETERDNLETLLDKAYGGSVDE